MTQGFFNPLLDTVSKSTVSAAEDAVAKHTWHGAGDQQESAMVHGIRTLLNGFRADIAQHYEREYEERHRQLKRLYHDLQDKEREQANDLRRRIREESGQRIEQHEQLYWLALRKRREGRKTVRLSDILNILELDQ